MATGRNDHDHLLEQLLEICENFFGHASQASHDELDAYLHAHRITGGPSWLIDMLGLARLRLQHQRHNGEPGTQTDA